MQVNFQEAASQLAHLLDLVQQGERVIITRDDAPVGELVLPAKRSFPFGIARNEPLVPEGDEWWKPMTDTEVDDWMDGR